MKHFYENIIGWSTYEDQGILLETIIKQLTNNLKIAEIGVYMGRCTALWNTILINNNIDYEYYAIDTFTGSEEHDKTINYHEITIKNLTSILNKINIIKNDSVLESENYENEFFDVVYIDASHDYLSVKNDIKTWLPKLKKNGIICGDDYIDGWPGVIKAVNEIFGDNVKKIGKQQWYVLLNEIN